VVVELVIRRNG